MGNQPTLRLLLTSVVLAIAGCGETSKGPIVDDPSTVAPQTVTIYQLAGLLGMHVSESTQTHVKLKNSANTVMLFTFSDGPVYVNAKSVGKIGTIERKDGRIHVSRSLVAQIRPALHKPASGSLVRLGNSSRCIVIDAGHGGKDPGATSVLGTREKHINLAVARKVASLLSERGFRVRMTRSSDRFIELEQRAAIANRLRADLFVSIHSDSFPKSSRRGYTMYVARSASQASFRAAGSIARAMSRTGLGSHGTQTADYKVLIRTRGPAVLVEMGYLTNRREAALLKSPSFQTRLAEAIADGISDYFG
ncbi:MAG: N-acetylmuramoyl-L-alanine amidase [Phycisphaerales bacterium]|nr:MAG: N-acetylmuramoyl-L-alanine amidase [Phycisphaerales bacterium]